MALPPMCTTTIYIRGVESTASFHSTIHLYHHTDLVVGMTRRYWIHEWGTRDHVPDECDARACDPRPMLRARMSITKMLLLLGSSSWSSLELQLDQLELAYELATRRLKSQVTSENEEEWKVSEQDKIHRRREKEEKVRLRVKRDMNSLKKKRQNLQCILHDYSPDPQTVKRFHYRGATASYTEVSSAIIPLVNRMHGRREGIVEKGTSRIEGFPTLIVYHCKSGETVTYAFVGRNNDIGTMSYDTAVALEKIHKSGDAHGAVQLSNLLLSADGRPLDLRDPKEYGLHTDAKWPAPEIIECQKPELIPLCDKQRADIYALGATIVELHFWEDGHRDPELISIDCVTRTLDMHELAPTKSAEKALGLEEIVRQCINVEAKERPTASQVRGMLEKVFKVTVLLESVKRIASRAARALPFWHGRNMFAYP